MTFRLHFLLASLALLASLSAPTAAAESVQNNAQSECQVSSQSTAPVIVLAWQRVGSPLRMDA
jgi:hypothetical protein